jgi:hypothetical protein
VRRYSEQEILDGVDGVPGLDGRFVSIDYENGRTVERSVRVDFQPNYHLKKFSNEKHAQPNAAYHSWTTEHDDHLIALRLQELTFVEIAKRIGKGIHCCVDRCRYLERTRGITFAIPRKSKFRALIPRILALQAEGMTRSQIARHVGLSINQVKEIVRRDRYNGLDRAA